MTYTLSHVSAYFPTFTAKITVLPVQDEDGFLVCYDLTPDQRLFFAAGFGGITAPFGRFEYHNSVRKDFAAVDCKDNSAKLFKNGAILEGSGTTMLIGDDFGAVWELDTPEALEEPTPSLLLAGHDGEKQIAKCSREIRPGEHFKGRLLVLKNSTPERLTELLADKKLEQKIKNAIRKKYAASRMLTPEPVLNSAFSDLQIALDASFHENTFYHGAIGYHAPFLGWRGWYGNTFTGPQERVKKAIFAHFNTMLFSDQPEKVWYDGADRPDLDHVGTQYHHLENPSGRIPALLHRDDIYDMQEVAIDMTLHYLEATGDLETGKAIYERLEAVLDHQERIYDPDGDGVYQSFLNTWISDGHCYNGGGCAQASSYNYFANLRAGLLGKAAGLPSDKFFARAEKIRKAVREKLFLPEEGIVAEYFDTIGNKLLHAAPELSTLYLACDSEMFDAIEMHRILCYAEDHIPSTTFPDRKGKFYYSADWKPKKYSTCGIFPAENAALALAWYRNGESGKAFEILKGIIEAYERSNYPGALSHVMSALGAPDGGDIDFSDVSGCVMRLLCEGLWGIDLRLLENQVRIAPHLPEDWKNATISLPGLRLEYIRNGNCLHLNIATDLPGVKQIDLPLFHAGVEQLLVNGEEHPFESVPSFDTPRIRIRTEQTGRIEIQLYENETLLPALDAAKQNTFTGNLVEYKLVSGTVKEVFMPDSKLLVCGKNADSVRFRAGEKTGKANGVILAALEDALIYLPFSAVVADPAEIKPVKAICSGPVEHLDLAPYFNCSFTQIHEQKFMSPRPAGYSIGMQRNGRYAWEWNHFGHNGYVVDDSALRSCGGFFKLPQGGFQTPAEGDNAVCVSIWDNFPTSTTIPLSGKAAELELYVCGTTNAMQSFVENGRITVEYADGSSSSLSLIHQKNFDDFLVPALQQEFDYFYFSKGNHGMIYTIALDPEKELTSFSVEAVANEVIISILGANLKRG